ncbi:MAG: TIM barrel protein [Clostridia bacterium]|nr:TIM barrel protein [Clostridia bacterium]MDD4387042.1 TIM barrel protein [Clostridia bacterium]
MNFLISLNSKIFLKYDTKQLMNTITSLDVNKVIKGIEIYIDMTNEEEKEYCLSLSRIMKNNNWIIQLHSADMQNIEKETIERYLQYYNQIALIYGEKIKLTLHPATEGSRYESIIKTIETVKHINKYIERNKLDIELLIENLNEHNGMLRCNIYQVYEMVDSLKTNGVTFDMGHYVYDYSNDYTNLDNEHADKIRNIHIHDIDNNRDDHHPFYYNNVKIQEIVKYINEINYKENIVLEYGLEYLEGETFEDKITEYIKQIEYVKRDI